MSRYPLILDKTDDSEDISLLELIPSPDLSVIDQMADSPTNELIAFIEDEQLYNAINNLTKKQQEVLNLIYVQP